MCGVAGIYRPLKASTSSESMEHAVRAMNRTLVHRGPDAEGLWTDPQGRCVLGHRRLSIIDTSDAGRQPMATADGRLVVSYNGELYNYLEIRAELEAAGFAFRGRTDTEVVLQAFAAWGVDALKRFDGMFAIALFDATSGEILLARDAFGEKPLYYTQLDTGTYAFASELQAIELAPGVDLDASIDAMAEMLTFQYVGAPRSIYQSVKKLRPGHWLRIEPSGRTQTGRFFAFRPGSGGYTNRSMADLADELEEILVASIQRRMIADVPLGAFLSGGVDSSTVCALIRRRLNRPLMTFSIGFDGAPESEHLVARKFGEHLGTTHFDQILTPDTSEFLLDFGAKVDEPNGDSSCLPTYLLSEFARQHVTVSISGDGGDEMFGGYGRYLAALDHQQRYENGNLPGWKPGSSYYGSQILVGSEPLISELFGFVPQGFADHVGLLRTDLDEGQNSLLAAMRKTDVENYMPGAVLPKVDRMSMRHSLEVRTPFLNVELARFAERLPERLLVAGGRGKLILKEISYRYLPRELVDLPKQGFALPMSDWAKDSLLDASSRLLERQDSRLRQAFGPSGIERFMARQRSPGNFSPYQVWGVVALESWLRHHPAKLPTFSSDGVTTARGVSNIKEDRKLLAASIAPGIYVVGQGDPSVSVDEILRNEFATLPREIESRALELLVEASGDPVSTEIISLPNWANARSISRLAADPALKGATLLFNDASAALRFDYAETERWRASGASRLILRNPYVDEELLELSLRKKPTFLKLVSMFFRRSDWLSTNRAAVLFGAKRIRRMPDGAWQSSLLRNVDAFPDVEFATDYLVFEGGRQLPPLPLSHSIIAEQGGGRYSVFDQQLTVSPTEPGREHCPYWMLRLTDADRKVAPTVTSRWAEKALSADAAKEAVDALVSRQSSRQQLQPGDPIVVCTHALPPGGAERQWVYLAQALAEAGYDVTFVTFRSLDGVKAHYVDVLTRSNIRHVDASAISAVEALKAWPRTVQGLRLSKVTLVPDRECVAQLVAAFSQIRPKAVITQLDDPNTIGGLAAQIADVPCHVMSFRNYNPSNFPYIANDWYQAAYEALCKSPRVLLSGNHDAANADYANWIGLEPSRVAHIPNAIDTSAFTRVGEGKTAKLRHELGLKPNDHVILGVTRLSAEKDPATWLEVCGRVLAEDPHAQALLAGVGPMRMRLEEQIASLGLEQRIRLLGRRTDISALMSVADVFLLTSRFEGMPNVIMEAGSIGIPVVATAAGASEQLVAQGITGFIHPIGDVEGLASSCLELLANPEKATGMGRNARRLMQSQYNKVKLGERYLALLNNPASEASLHPFCSDDGDSSPAAAPRQTATMTR